ncbi:MAG: hypothetical protein LBI26_02740 [Holosporales bacterium]|jgi:hypothetical protein|nr:hypothetical protein [Holosporales bacterium]
MRFIKKLFLYALSVVILFLISVLKYDVGVFYFKYKEIKTDLPTNILLIVLICVLFVISIIRSFLKTVRSLIKIEEQKRDFEEQKRLTEMILTHKNLQISDKYKMIKDALFLDQISDIEQYKKNNTLLFVYKIKDNINFFIKNNNIDGAVKLINIILGKFCGYINVVEDELLDLIKYTPLNFDPRKFKYNLSNEFTKKYLGIKAIRSENTRELVSYNREYPGSFEIVAKLVQHTKKNISLIADCFNANPDRNLLNLLKEEEKTLENAEIITKNVSDNNLEKLWFLCMLATETNLITKANEVFLKIVDINADGAERFFIQNYSKFLKNTDLLKKIKEKSNENKTNQE